MTEPRYCPPPWHVVELADAFCIENATGLTIAHIRFNEDPEQLAFSARLLKKEARYVAIRVAAVPHIEIAMIEIEEKHEEVQAATARRRA